ncbi:MAG TPA: hypothetical protein VN745_10710 [Verrucomicrobiae bacterium]|nr:hypothetical protein [Verrucomicrobiae bacterium]
MQTRRNAIVASAVLVSAICMLASGAQRKPVEMPILEARDISAGCCDTHFNLTYLRVFADGKVEWQQFEGENRIVASHHGRLPARKLKAVERAVDSMKGLKEFYAGKSAENNIDSWFHLDITGRRRNKTYHTDIAFAFPVNGKNYADLPDIVRTVACNVAVTRSELAKEKMDVEMCRRYYVGW